MSHEQPHIDNDHEDPDAWSTWAIGIGGSFLMITTVAIACGIYYSSATTEAFDKNVNIRYEQRDMVRDAQHAVLVESAHWVSGQHPETGETVERLVLPINDAMNIIAGNSN
ncbi:MAG: hypothetical protein QF718_00815 [Phycisphaerales bacterium]|jgi:hypothetical protein|nr:hypothetical protein [Phycisphaerales bacterium]